MAGKAVNVLTSIFSDDEAVKICGVLGGLAVYCAKRRDARNHLIKELDDDLAERLCNHFNGETVYIPNFKQVETFKRNQKIARLVREGKKLYDISREFNVSERWIRKVANNTQYKD
jgi:Mor family transcriptional regulator